VSSRKVVLAIIFISAVHFAAGQAPDSTDSARLYYRTGKEYADLYKLDTAIFLLEKSIKMFAAIHPGGSVDEALACHRLADIYKYDIYNFDEAERIYEYALSLMMKLDPSDIPEIIRLYYSLATTNRSQRDYETSISWCQKAIDGAMSLKDNKFLERAYSILGNIYRDMHRYDSAVECYRKGVAVNNLINKGKQNETLAGLYSGWGDTNYVQGNYDDAATRLNQAVTIYRTIGPRDKSIYMHTVRLLAEVSIKRKDLKNALTFLKVTEGLQAELGLDRGGPVSAFHKTYGDYYLGGGDTLKAYEFYQKALQATTRQVLDNSGNPDDIDKVDFKDFAYDALLAKAGILIARNDLDQAITCFTIAETLMVAGRNELDTEDAKWNYTDANFSLYESALSALYDQHNRSNDVAFHFIESGKSKSLADALQEVELRKVLGKGDTLLSELRQLREHSLTLQHQIDEKNESSVRDELIRTGNEISALEASINRRYPSYLKTRYEGVSVQLSQLREKIKTLDAAFVEYFWGFDHIYALVLSGDSTGFYQLGSPTEVEASVRELLGQLTTRVNQYSPEAIAAFAGISNKVYTVLVKPFDKTIQGRKRLIIVPDGALIQVPFETLVTGLEPGAGYNKLAYMLNDHIVSYGFSGHYFTSERKAPARNPSLLAFGFTGGSDVRSGDASKAEISGTETELVTLSGKFPNGTFLYGSGVTEKKFKDEAANYDLLHLAVHGSGDTGEDYSATLYFRDEDGGEDGRLYWYELYGMNLKASLAVLSSCESGIGKTYRGEGMLSMANAFTFAGCSNVVMGLWKVDDQVSVKLMDTFYSELLEGTAIDEALALAKRTYLASADQVSANPKIWGSLVAYGEAQVVRPDEIHTGWVVLAVVVLVAAIFLLVRKTKK
jgi:CHAT domain-containing protein